MGRSSRLRRLMKKFKDIRINEAPYVASDMEMVRSILNKIEDDISKLHLKSQFEKAWPDLKVLAKIAGYGISKKKQARGRTYRYDLKR